MEDIKRQYKEAAAVFRRRPISIIAKASPACMT